MTTEATTTKPIENTTVDTPTTKNPDHRWYVVHVTSGHEGKVANTLKQRIAAAGMQDSISEILIPTQEKITVSRGKKKTIKERLFPGYVLVKMELANLTWHIVRNTPGVTSFVGAGGKPTPLQKDEVKSITKFMELKAPKFESQFKVGDSVRVINGPFKEFLGSVENIDVDKGRVKVMISVFGRETPMDLDFAQVAPL